MEYTKQQKRNYDRKVEKFKHIKAYNKKKKELLAKAKLIQAEEAAANLRRKEWRISKGLTSR